MIRSNIGIDKSGKVHQSELTDLERACVSALENTGLGRENAISAGNLAMQIGLNWKSGTRDLRELINHLIMTHKLPIMCEAGIGGGYYFPANMEEPERFKQAFHRRAMTSLVKMSRGIKASYVDTIIQYAFGFDDPETTALIERLRLTADEDPVPAWVQLVTRLLDRMSGDPEKYAEEIRRIQATHGDIFVSRDKVEELKRETERFQKLLNEIAA